jgi:hypothetical protein
VQIIERELAAQAVKYEETRRPKLEDMSELEMGRRLAFVMELYARGKFKKTP